MILSILICSLEDRKEQLAALLENLKGQIIACGAQNVVEIITNVDQRQITTGKKRNLLLEAAEGKYSVYCDDDDEVSPYYIEEIIEATKQDADCITFNGYMTTNGVLRMPFDIALNNPYREALVLGKLTYLRFPNHITPMKTEIARSVPFENISFMEDYKWAKEIHDKGLLKTEVKINKELYHYKFKTGKK